MARIISEQKNINNNVFEYEKRLQSPYNRFIDRAPTYVTLYHISNNDTTVGEGWKDTDALLGPNSSLRFNKITNFPLYGISQIVPNLDENDQGLDIQYEGECIFLPHTIKPFQNDFFVIEHINKTADTYVFRITSVEFDNIHPDNYYKSNFILENTDPHTIELLENQLVGKYECITENIGTEEVCIIETDRLVQIRKVQDIYDNLASTYISIFYNEKYNCILGDKPCSKLLYDPYLIEFCNKWKLFNRKDRLTTYMFSQEITDNLFRLKYERSVWRYIERNDIALLTNFGYFITPAINLPFTTFALWHDERVWILDIPSGRIPNIDDTANQIIDDEFIFEVKNNGFTETAYATLLKRYLRGEELTIYDIPENIHTTLLTLNGNLDYFFTTPMILYIMKQIIHKELTDKTKLTSDLTA